jgi:isopentenyl-diphosphate delta-isomerase
VHTYVADDPATGRTEREFDHVVVGHVADDLRLAPDPAEVAQTRWVALSMLSVEAAPNEYAPWLAGVLSVAIGPRY